MKTALFIAAILLMVATGTLGGRITSWGDIDISNPNKGYMSYINLYVQLDNKLPTGHVLRVTLPFTSAPSWSTSGAANVYSSTSASKGAWLSTTPTSIATGTAAKNATASPYSTYFTFSADLAAATNYIIRLNFNVSSPPSDVGFLGYIQLETMSPAISVTTTSGSDIAITYDLNNAFAPVHIFPAPTNLTLSSSADTNANVTGASSIRQFKITPGQNFYYWPTIVLSWDNSAFSVTNVVSLDTGVSTTATPLTNGSASVAGQYAWTTSGQSILISHNAFLNSSQTIIYNATVVNPPTNQSTTFKVSIRHRYNYNLTDVTQTGVLVQVTGAASSSSTSLSLTSQVLLSWGIDRNNTLFVNNQNLAKAFALYTSTTANPIYQAVNFVFGISTSLATYSSYTVNVQICAGVANCDVLENSIYSNMSSAACSVVWTTNISIKCTVPSVATSGNAIAARIWLLGGATATGVQSGSTVSTYALSDTSFGVISISGVNSSVTPPTSTPLVTGTQAGAPYNTLNYNQLPLVNLNGNGPMIGIPNNGTNIPSGASYASLWSSDPGTPPKYVTVASITNQLTAFPSTSTTPKAANSIYGGIYGSTTAKQNYNLALVTTATMFGGATVGATTTYNSVGTLAAETGWGDFRTLGLDIYLNPNVYTTTGTLQIASCWAANKLIKQTTVHISTGTDSATNMVAHCFLSVNSTQFTRLRYMFASRSSSLAQTTANNTQTLGVEATPVATPPLYATFFWENAVQVTNAYAGASIRADQYIGDFYGLFYTVTWATPATQNPQATGLAGTTVQDLGEFGSMANGPTYVVGTPFFWSQMMVGPFGGSLTAGGYVAGSIPAYYQYKTVFISNLDTNTGSYTSNHLIYLLRIRGNFQTGATTSDYGLYPSSGRIAVFLSIPTSGSSWEPLAPVYNTTNTINTYNTASAIPFGTVPLVGNGAVRCWNNNLTGNCLHERRGRPQPAAAPSVIGTLDLYQIITADAAFTANFSTAIVLKPRLSMTTSYTYRFGFSNNNLYYIQSWDQYFDNAATVANGVWTPPGTVTTVTPVPSMPADLISACVLPYTASSTTAPSIRIQPGPNDTDNTLVNGALAINVKPATFTTVTKLQGSIVWCGPWNFKVSTSFALSAQTALEGSTYNDKCVAFDYLSENSTAYYCLYCPIAGTGVPPVQTSSNPIYLNMTNFFTGPQVNILNPTFSNLAADDGTLLETGYCTTFSGPGTANTTNPNYWLNNTITGVTASGSSYNLQGQKATISFNAPSTLNSAIVDSLTITGRTSINGTDNFFPYATLDSVSVCKLSPGGSTNFSTFIACTASYSGGVITVNFTGNNAAYANQTTWTLILWGLNGLTYTGTGSSQPNTTYFYIQTFKSNTLVDASTTVSGNLASWALNTSPSLNFTTNNVGYQRPIVGARGYFRFDITWSSRLWYSGDKIVLSVDPIVTSTQNANTSVVKCRITDTSDVIQYNFQSCTLNPSNSPATLTIYALTPTQNTGTGIFDFSATSYFRVYLDNVVTINATATKVIYGSVYFNNGTNPSLTKNSTGTDITTQNLTTAQTMTTPVLTKYFAAANDFQDMAFLLTTASAFSSAGRITIAFPSYYNPGLTTHPNSVYCTINNIYTQCTVGSSSSSATVVGLNTLAVYGYSGALAAGTSFVLKVGGIRAPPASYAIEQFYVQINTDNSENTANISSAVSFNDTAYSAQTIVPLNVNWFTISTTQTRTTATISWYFGLNSTTNVSTTQAISAFFPESWGLGWGLFSPTCTVVDATNNSLVYASNQSIFGNLVQLNVSTPIPNTAVVILSCQNIRTPENDGTYPSNEITIRVHDQNGSTVYQRSAPGVHNVNFQYAYKATLAYLSWNVTGSLTSPASLTAGTYGLGLLLSVTTGSRSSKTFTISPANSQFSFLSSTAPFYLTTGAGSNSTLLGCAQSVPIGLYTIAFTISDNSTYVAPPRLWVSVNNNVQTITPSATTMTTYFIGTSTVTSFAPLIFDTSLMPPYSDITITPVAPTGNTNFTFTPSSIKLTPASPKAYFTFSTTSATASATGAATYSFTVTGTNAASYAVSSGVTFSLTADSTSSNTGAPTLTIAADGTDTNAATSKILTLTLNVVTQATIYWAVTLQGQSITDATAIQSAAAALTAYNANSANQAQYGTFYQYASPSKTPTNFQVTGLFPNTGYTITAVAVSLANKTSTVASYTFVTGANAATIQRWLFNYTTYPSQAQRQTLLCQITQILAVPAINVRDVNGEICGNTTAFYNSTNSTGDLGVYFYPLQATTDAVMPNLATLLNTTATINSLNTTLSTGTSGLGFANIIPDGTIKNAVPAPTFPSSASVGQTWASFSGIALNDTGFVFIAIGSNSTSAPTPVALKQAAAGILTNTGLSQIQVLYYYPSGGSLSYNFTGLSAATTYNAYLLASNNDPSFLQNFTSVTTVAFTTSSTGSTTSGQIGVVFSVMAIFASVISLLFA